MLSVLSNALLSRMQLQGSARRMLLRLRASLQLKMEKRRRSKEEFLSRPRRRIENFFKSILTATKKKEKKNREFLQGRSPLLDPDFKTSTKTRSAPCSSCTKARASPPSRFFKLSTTHEDEGENSRAATLERARAPRSRA